MTNIKTLAISTLFLFAISCGSSSKSSDIDAIISSMKQITGCNGGTYTTPTAAQITEIEAVCTKTELSTMSTYLACLAPATCNKDQAAITACGNRPTISAQCKLAP